MSISNAREYRISREQLARFQQAIEALEGDTATRASLDESLIRGALLEQARQQADELRRVLEEFQSLSQ